MQLRSLFLILGISPVPDDRRVQSRVQKEAQEAYLVRVTRRIR